MTSTEEALASMEAAEPTGEPLPTGDAPAAEPEFVPSDADLCFSTKKFVLQLLLERTFSVVPTKDIMPVLKNFLVEATSSPPRLRVVATDLDLSIVSESQMVSVSRPGTAVFPGRRFLEIVREGDGDEVLIDVRDGKASIHIGRTQWELLLQDGSEYPDIPETADIELASVDRVRFLGGINAVRYAACTEVTRPQLMMLDIRDGKIRASDGVRFQQADLNHGQDSDFNLPDLQIPVGAVDDLVKLLRSSEAEMVQVGEAAFHLVFKIGSDWFISNKLMAQFPDMDNVLLKPALQNDQKLAVDRMELLEAIKRVRITSDPETSAILLELDPDSLKVRSKDKFGNEALEVLTVFWQHPHRVVVVNHRFLTEMLTMADARSSEFYFGSQDTKTRLSPVLLKEDETGMFGLIQQMRPDWVVGE